MSTYVITGETTGVGTAIRKLFQGQGHEVLNIDYKGGDYLADLSTVGGRQDAIDEVLRRYPDGVGVLICDAGVGPATPPKTVFALNFFASVQLAEGPWPPLKKKHGNCIITSSSSITNMIIRPSWVDILPNVTNEEKVMEFAEDTPRNLTPSCCGSPKRAPARQVRRISSSWAVDRLRINSVAPSNTTTPMTRGMTAEQINAALLIPTPTCYGRKEFLDVGEIANRTILLAFPITSSISGVILFMDGGIDALPCSEQI